MLRHLPRRCSVTALIALAALGTAHAHEDDPKVLSTQAPTTRPSLYLGQTGGSAASFGFTSGGGISLITNLTPSQLDGNGGNDCWGYTSPSGREYALYCSEGSTIFIEITNPASPQIIATHSAASCLWRDVKVFGHHAYSVSECGAGIQVFDMSSIDSGSVPLVNTITSGGTTDSHNVAIDEESGYLYRCGGGSDLGLRIYDLNGNPAAPAYVSTWQDRYVHDAQIVTYTSGPFAGKEIAFCCGGGSNGSVNTRFEVLDVTNKNNIQVLGTVFYPNAGYSHEGWLSEDRQYFYLGDEFDESNANLDSTTYVIDVSDINNPSYVGAFDNGNPAITHNLYTHNGYIFEANYRAGIRIFDASVSPTNPPEVAFFDTYPADDDKDYNGLWSCYPYFPSGTVIGSDRESGLFIWNVGGLLIDISFPNGTPSVLDPGGETVRVDISGAAPGTEELVYDAGAGQVTTSLVNLGSGQFDAVFPPLACGSSVTWTIQAATSGGTVVSSAVQQAVVADSLITVVSNDMETNAGWTGGAPGDTATTGQWERVDPIGTAAAPEDDHSPAGSMCWITDQHTGGGVGSNDVDGGFTTLLSPVLDMAGLTDPEISYWRWYVNNGNNSVDDQFVIDITNGGPWINVETLGPGGQSTGWKFHSFRVSDFVVPSATVQMRFIASDTGSGSIVEAGIDDFEATDLSCGPACGATSYCTSNANSTGNAATISALGSTSVSTNDLALEAIGCPSSQPGIFYFGPNQISVAFGNGTRCVGGSVFRFPPIASNVFGVATLAVDYSSLPFGASIQAGDTWNFQYWFRDPAAGGANFDLSDGLEALFCP